MHKQCVAKKHKNKQKEVTETDEAMEASTRGLELHVQSLTVAMLMIPPPKKGFLHNHCELRYGGSQDLKAIS